MKMVVGTIGKGGERTIIAKPQVLVLENHQASVALDSKDNGSQELSLSVVAQRKAL